MYEKKMSIEEHQEVAESLVIAMWHLNRMYFMIQSKYGKSHPLCKKLMKLTAGNLHNGIFCDIQSILDDEWERECHGLSSEEFEELGGFIHYNHWERYENIMKKIGNPELGIKKDYNPGRGGRV